GLAAIAGPARPFVVARPGQGIVPPFAGNAGAAPDHLLIDDEAAADPGAEDDAEHNQLAGRRAVDSLGQGEAVGVVLHADRAAERGLEVALEGLTVEDGAVRVLQNIGLGRQRARRGDADRAAPA